VQDFSLFTNFGQGILSQVVLFKIIKFFSKIENYNNTHATFLIGRCYLDW